MIPLELEVEGYEEVTVQEPSQSLCSDPYREVSEPQSQQSLTQPTSLVGEVLNQHSPTRAVSLEVTDTGLNQQLSGQS